jgi:hypothetical protein
MGEEFRTTVHQVRESFKSDLAAQHLSPLAIESLLTSFDQATMVIGAALVAEQSRVYAERVAAF